MKKNLFYGIVLFLVLSNSFSFGQQIISPTYTITSNTNESQTNGDKIMQFRDFVLEYTKKIGKGLPIVYKEISLKFSNIQAGTDLEDAFKKMVYMGFVTNKITPMPLFDEMTEDQMGQFVSMNFKTNLPVENGRKLTYSKFAELMERVPTFFQFYAEQTAVTPRNILSYPVNYSQNFDILNDVYTKITNDHYNSENIDKRKLIQGAIKGMSDSTSDRYTTYFPPAQAKNFRDELNGSFEGIGAFIEMAKAGELKIVSPISGSPAEKAGIIGGDQILQVDDFIITPEVDLATAVSKIKGLSGSTVRLIILRGLDKLTISVVRAKIVVPFVESKILDNGDFYLKMNSFGIGSAGEFNKHMAKINSTQKLIIDLRNNPGGSLEEVISVLGNFVKAGSGAVIVQGKYGKELLNSAGNAVFQIGTRKIMILINGGTASAAEIMAGTIKDYFPNSKIIGEKSFGKGSVQLVEEYYDGSSLKYTISKWLTGKYGKSIDGVGIAPDVNMIFDTTGAKAGLDNQLNFAKLQ